MSGISKVKVSCFTGEGLTEELVNLSGKELDRLSLVERVDRREISQVEAATLAGCSITQVRRWLARYRQSGAAGVASRNRFSLPLPWL
jgi:hypothetical protein